MIPLQFPNHYFETNSLDLKDIWFGLTKAPIVIIRGHKETVTREWTFEFVQKLGRFRNDDLQIGLGQTKKKDNFSKFNVFPLDNEDKDYLHNGPYISAWHNDNLCYADPPRFSIITCERVDGNPHPNTEFKNLAALYKYSSYKEEAEGKMFTYFKMVVNATDGQDHVVRAIDKHDHPLVQEFCGMKYYSFNPGYIDRQEDPTVLELCRKLRNEASNPMLDYKHVYQTGDVVIWNQLMTNHRVINKKGDKRRICWRASFDDNLVREYYERN